MHSLKDDLSWAGLFWVSFPDDCWPLNIDAYNQWVGENNGEGQYQVVASFADEGVFYAFSTEQEAIMFRLRWT